MDRSSTTDLLFLTAAAAVMAAGYVSDLAGAPFSPAALLACGVLIAVGAGSCGGRASTCQPFS
ncbi:MAG TPA: hypothetical protein VGI12_13345 [Vicinamibacterales bacterium]